MTAFADYLDLRTAVIETVRDDSITDVFDRLTKLAESRLNRVLRCRDQITTTTVVVSGGTGALPADFQELIGVYDSNGYEYVAQPSQAVRVDNDSFYTIEGSNLVADDRTYTIQYYAALSTLTASATTSNWLLQKYPEVYLYSVAVEAAKYLRDTEAGPILAQMRDEAIRDARADDERQRYSRMRVRVGGVTP